MLNKPSPKLWDAVKSDIMSTDSTSGKVLPWPHVIPSPGTCRTLYKCTFRLEGINMKHKWILVKIWALPPACLHVYIQCSKPQRTLWCQAFWIRRAQRVLSPAAVYEAALTQWLSLLFQNHSHCLGCDMASHCRFDLHFWGTSEIKYLWYASVICLSLEMPPRIPCLFLHFFFYCWIVGIFIYSRYIIPY